MILVISLWSMEQDSSNNGWFSSSNYGWNHQRTKKLPKLPIVWGIPVYAADHTNSSRIPDDADSSWKYSSSHPTLTPGIFTLYCLHAICYGFEVMRSHESPRHPFEIFLTHFEQPPTTIIYDNSCKLHQYILYRQLIHFQSTNFLVDRFHWRGHAGCSSGYTLNRSAHILWHQLTLR